MFNIVNLSRLQFAITAMYHFIFVPLTIGLSIIIAMLETIYVISNNKIYKFIIKFLGKLFSISFALGIATGLIMEFQFGTNWSYFSHYVGDIFGIPLVIEGIVAFFLESTFIGLFLFGWKKLSKIQHLIVTWLMVIGSNLSALWIIIANGWMQNPISYNFNINNMRIEIINFSDIFFNKISQLKFFHTIMASYSLGSIFILSISSYYFLKNINLNFAKKLFVLCSIFGMLSIILTILIGDESGYEMNKIQKTKLAAIEAEWNTQNPPASFNLFSIPSQKNKKNYFLIKIPYLSGILITRSLNTKIIGLKDILLENKLRILNGIKAFNLLKKIKSKNFTNDDLNKFNIYKKDLGYGLLLKKYNHNMININEKQINKAIENSIPKVFPLYFAFRLMVLSGLFLFIIYFLCLWKILTNSFNKQKWIYKLIIFSTPIPWIAMQSGWFVSEYGRQPWIIYNILPTAIGNSILNKNQIIFSIFSIIILYIIISIISVYIILKIIKKGPI